jgi:ATP-dependent helicase/nuclease subunit B
MAGELLESAKVFGKAADLTGTLVIAPTRAAGRKLREALAKEAAARGYAGVLTPKILTPEAFIRECGPAAPRAPADVARLVMARALASFSPEALSDLFPKPPVTWDAKSLATAAESSLRARSALGDAADTPDFAAVAKHPDNRETARWGDLARVEARYREMLSKLGYTDADDARAVAVRSPRLPAGTKTVVLAALPDPSSALRRLIENAPAHRDSTDSVGSSYDVGFLDGSPLPEDTSDNSTPGIRCVVIVAADAAQTDAFDAYGAPLPEYWSKAPMPWEDFDRQVFTPENPEALARQLAKLFAHGAPDGRSTGFILADAALTRPVEQAVADAGGLANPAEGVPLDTHPHAVVLRDWAAYLRDRSWESLGRLLRRPAFAKLVDTDASLVGILADWDKTEENLLPHDTSPLRETSDEAKAVSHTRGRLTSVDRLRREFTSAPLDRAVAGFLQKLGTAGAGSDEAFAEAVAIETINIQNLATQLGDLDASELLSLLLRRLRDTRHYPDNGAERPALRGWLELLWEDSPHTLIAGVNEGRVPESFSADPFLPGEFRKKLGLPGDETRLARDAYTLARALSQRADGRGRLDVFAPRHDAGGEPLRPSRLLTLGAGEALAERVMRLFSEPAGAAPEPARTRAWKWNPRVDAVALRKVSAGISPTAFKDYLECPLRFYLKRVAGARPTEPDKAEPDAAAFGDLVHNALAAYALDATTAALTDEPLIRDALFAKLDSESRRRHGETPALAALVQRHAAHARLAGFARVQAELRREGCSIAHAERAFTVTLHPDDGAPFTVEGRFDRIDRHADGRIRVIDYKTSDSGDAPAKAHIATADRDRAMPGYAYTDNAETNAKGEAKTMRWTNLQLPLYAEAALILANEMQATGFPEIAYAVLPASASDVAMSLWEGYDRLLHADALRCAAGIAGDIRARHFQPGPKPPRYDDFEDLLGDDADDAVDWETFSAELAKS